MATAPIVTFSASSSASSAPSTSTSAANSTSTDSSGGGGGGQPSTSSATLYLYTFLATLVLLLAVSAAIVVRSYLIRQRQRRLLDDAVRDGLLVPAFTGGAGFGRAALARKPELVDVYLGSAPAQREKPRRHSAGTGSVWSVGGGWWNAVMPVAAREVQEGPTPQGKSKSSYPPSISRTPPPPSTFARLRQALRIAMPMPSVGAGVLPAPATARHPETLELATTVPTTPDRSAPPARRSLDVGFLIAMPAPPVAHHEVGYLPYVEFGITRVGAAADRESEGLLP